MNTPIAIDKPAKLGKSGDMTQTFHGAKAAVFIGANLLVYQRDRGVPWPGYWDFPGGGREGDEGPTECLRREIFEEFGLSVSDDSITWGRAVPSMANPTQTAWFFTVHLGRNVEADIQFGSEGQRYAVLPPDVVANMPNLVPALHDRLGLWLQETGRDPI